MKDLSLHILDIVENSVKAGAKTVTLEFSWHDTVFSFSITDDGPGFPEGIKEDPSDPFRTTRKERKVGLGLALLKDSAEQCGGKIRIGEGEKGGVKIKADFDLGHIDSKPVGDIEDLIITCMTAWPHMDWIVKVGDKCEEILNTIQIREELGEINMNSPEIRNFMSRQLLADFQPLHAWLGKIKVSFKTRGKKMKKLILMLASIPILGTFIAGCTSYNEAYKMTPAGEIELKQIPKSTVLVTETQGEYFDKANPLFMRLFNYIKKNEVPMTVPVEAEFSDKAAMKFYVAPGQQNKNLADQGEVKVVNLEERTVVSYGTTGSYSKENVDEAKTKLESWLKEHPELKATGKPYAVFWNSPFHLWFMKHYEIHIPVEKKQQ